MRGRASDQRREDRGPLADSADEAYGERVDSGPPVEGDVMLNLNTVMICSEDPQALTAFYTEVLGEPGWQDSGYVGWQAGSATLMIGPHSEVKGRNEGQRAARDPRRSRWAARRAPRGA